MDGNAAIQAEHLYISSPIKAGCINPTSNRDVARDGNGRANGVEERLLWALEGRSIHGELKQRSTSTILWKINTVFKSHVKFFLNLMSRFENLK